MDIRWPVSVTALGAVACGTRLWKGAGSRHLTVVVKATLELVPGERAKLVTADALVDKDRHYLASPGRSVEAASDLAPFLSRCDVTLRGHAHAPPGQTLPASTARLSIFRGQPLLDKKVFVYGDRDPQSPERPTPFQRIAVDYEHAFGGKSNKDNPVGRGADKSGAGATLPNVVDAVDPARPAGFAPLSRFWGERARALGALGRGVLDAEEPTLPEGYDWRYYQAAPLDQQIAYLVGDEWIVIDGMHPALPRISTQLPAIRGAALMYAFGGGVYGPATPIKLEADTLAIDTDRLVASVVWRGSTVLDPKVDLQTLRVFGSVQLDGGAIPWPNPKTLEPPTLAAAHAPEEALSDATRMLSPEEALRAAQVKADPFGPPGSRPFVPAASADVESLAGATITLSPAERGGGGAAPLPFPAPREPESPLDGTMAVNPAAVARAIAPFQIAKEGTATPAAPIEGAPWSKRSDAAPPSVGPTSMGPTSLPTPSTKDVAIREQPVDFSAPPVVSFAATPPKAPARSLDETFKLSPRQAEQAAKTDATPFKPGDPDAPPPVIPSATKWLADDDGDLGGTISLKPGDLAALVQDLAPFPIARAQSRGPVSKRGVVGAGAKAVPRRESPEVPIVHAPSLTAATTPWQLEPPQDTLTLVVKATFELIPGEPMKLCDEPVLLHGDVFANDDPTKSLLEASDFAVMKPRADVLVTGSAHATGGSATHARVTVKFGSGKAPSGFERTIAVVGDRVWKNASTLPTPSSPTAFSEMPLTWERAFGGARFPDNPLGVGHGTPALPNLEEPTKPMSAPGDTPPPAGLGPVPSTWRARTKKLGTYGGDWHITRFPYFPVDFDPTYFQSAPIAQQVNHLKGDETFEIVGMHPDFPVLKGSLPGLRARAFALETETAGGDFFEVELRADTVHFDLAAMRVHILWRGVLEVTDDEAPEVETLFVMTEALARTPRSLDEAKAELIEMASPEEPEEDETPVVDLPAPKPTPEEQAATRASITEQMASGESLDGCDWAGAELLDMDFSGRSLASANLKDATLRGCSFAGANLEGALLAGADLTDADLRGAKLDAADLVGAKLERAKLDGASLEEADLSLVSAAGASFTKCRGTGVQLAGANLVGAKFDGAELPFLNLGDAVLDDASFVDATLSEVRLYFAKGARVRFDRAVMDEARGDEATFVSSSFASVRAAGSIWDKATLTGSVFTSAQLAGAGFARADCERAIFHTVDATEARFTRAKLGSAEFLKANLMAADFERADLRSADLRGANLHAAETWKAKLDGAKLELAILTKSKLAVGPRS